MHKAHRAQLEQMELMVRLVLPDLKGHRVYKGPKDQREPLERWGHKDQRELMVQMVLLDLQDHRVRKVFKVQSVQLGLME